MTVRELILEALLEIEGEKLMEALEKIIDKEIEHIAGKMTNLDERSLYCYKEISGTIERLLAIKKYLNGIKVYDNPRERFLQKDVSDFYFTSFRYGRTMSLKDVLLNPGE